MVRYCAVYGCIETSYTNKKRRFFGFPSNEERCWHWIYAIGREDLERKSVKTLHSNYFVCELHFDDCDIPKKNLRKDAIPRLLLPPLKDTSDVNMSCCSNTLQEPGEIPSTSQSSQAQTSKVLSETTPRKRKLPIEQSESSKRRSLKSITENACNVKESDMPPLSKKNIDAQEELKRNTQGKSCRKWLTSLNREDLLDKDNFNPHSHSVCEKHFDDSSFKRGLKRGSFPVRVSTEQKQKGSVDSDTDEQTCVQECTDPTETHSDPLEESEEEAQTSTSLSAQIPRKRLSEKLHSSQNKCRRLTRELKKIQKELEGKNTSITSEHPDDDVGKRFQKLIEWQNNLKSRLKGTQYESEYKVFALNLYYANPYAYRLLQKLLKLPNKYTINRFKTKITPKLDDRVMKSLELKIESLPDAAKNCIICVDKMTLKRNLYYDTKTDEVIGFQNVNGKISPEIANVAYTIMLQGIHINWKQPIAYALLASTEHYEELDLWLEQVISKLSAAGIKVRAVTSDQGSNFDKFAKEIKHVTVEKPYFIYDDKKIFYIFDVPHLIKCIRNNLITSDFHYDDKKISWEFIKQLYNDQKFKNLKLIPELTDSHLDPDDFKKMEVKYAVQVFSRTVSAALHTYIDFGIIPEEARPTAQFVETMNNFFDVLNSSRINCKNKYRNAFKKCDYQVQVLDDALDMFSNIKAIDKITGKNNTAHMKSIINNTEISIRAIKLLYEDLKNEGIQYIFTQRLNQDCLEKLFGTIRQHSGSTEPTPIQFQRAFSEQFVCNMLKSPPNANCEADIDDILLQTEEVMKTYNLCAPPLAETSVVCLDGETDYRMDLPEENALTYVSGYLLFKCMAKRKCHNIDETLKSLPDLGETNLFTKYETYNKKSGFYGALKMPPEEFIKYIEKLEEAFTKHFENVIQGNPGAKLYGLLQAVLPQTPCECYPLNYLLKLFIRLRLFATLKLNNKNFKRDKNDIKKLNVKHL